MPPVDPAALSAALATVRQGEPVVGDRGYAPHLTAYIDACELIARHFLALLDAGELVRVRGMEWEKFFDDPGAQHFAKTIFGLYRATSWEWSVDGKPVSSPSLVESKLAAEAHYRSRLAAALEPLLPEVRT